MRASYLAFAIAFILMLTQCANKETTKGGAMGIIDKPTIEKAIKALTDKNGIDAKFRIERGVNQVATMWTQEDGTVAEFEKFCTDNFLGKTEDLDKLFDRISTNYEVLYGHYNKMTLDLNRPLHLNIGEKLPIDEIFGAYNPAASLSDDFFKNKIAFHILLNFPHYTLKEKTESGPNWTRKQWAFARVGDYFTSRVPSEIIQKISDAMTASGSYIADYNVYMGNLVDEKGNTFFPKDMKLLSHWNLRDELKAQYSKPDGLDHQKMIYEVMMHIINQSIPENVINKNDVQWNPFKNVVLKDGKEIQSKPEPNKRYQMLLNNFNAMKAADKFSPQYPTFIDRKFEEEFELPQKEVEELFVKFVSSNTIKKAGQLIAQRLGRKLLPFDIWYDGFKTRSTIPDEVLSGKTLAKYPNTEAFKKDIPVMLRNLSFEPIKADFIASKIDVDAARGSGHAWGADMKSENAHLRTRLSKSGMDYKGYNIATHELGHNVEQTITLQYVDYYMLRGVPNTAFTEAWAFVFQKRDLELLGMKENDPNKIHKMALDNLWSCYEIMGVSLVDMAVWKWLYANPTATAEQLKNETIKISKEVWNKYFAEVFGVKDQPVLAIYSHMIENPLYLSAYPIGHIIEFQMEQYMTGKPLGAEMERILKQGRIIPQLWMQGAVGSKLSIQPTLDAAEEAMKFVK